MWAVALFSALGVLLSPMSPFKLPCVGVLLSHVRLFATPWTVACQAPLSMGFSRQEYWSVYPFPSPGALPDPGMDPRSPALQADSLPPALSGKPSGLPYCPSISRHLHCTSEPPASHPLHLLGVSSQPISSFEFS